MIEGWQSALQRASLPWGGCDVFVGSKSVQRALASPSERWRRVEEKNPRADRVVTATVARGERQLTWSTSSPGWAGSCTCPPAGLNTVKTPSPII